jgi:hypothetical protein
MLEWYEIIALSVMIVPSELGWISGSKERVNDYPEDN